MKSHQIKKTFSMPFRPEEVFYVTYSKFLSTAFIILKENREKVQVIVRHEHMKELKEWVTMNRILTDESVLDFIPS
jgi:hypothetical protein